MSEEVTYADLKFPDSFKSENIQAFDNFETKGPTPSHACHHRVLVLSVLCLLLLIGLGILGGRFYVTSKKQMEKLNKLQNLNEEIQGNASQLLVDNMSISMKNNNLSITLQKVATKYCRELYKKNQEHKCKPCPKNWFWHRNRCYLRNEDYKSWQKSKMECFAKNASLWKINDTTLLNYIKSNQIHGYWLGLSPKYYRRSSLKLDDLLYTTEWNISNINNSEKRLYCGYLSYQHVYYVDCNTNYGYICEKLADPVKIENTLSEVTDGRI